MYFDDRGMGDPSLNMERLGCIVSYSDGVGQSKTIEQEIKKWADEYDVYAVYDLSYPDKPYELKYTEVFAAWGGVLIEPCDAQAAIKQYELAKTERLETVDYREKAKKESSLDKYELFDFGVEPVDKVALIPGSNMLEECVVKAELNRAYDEGAYIKPHPLTNEKHWDRLVKEYGEDRVIPMEYSGYSVMANAKELYVQGTTELALYGMLLGKKIHDIGTRSPKGGYRFLYETLYYEKDPGQALNWILNSKRSGIIFPDTIDRTKYFIERHSKRYGYLKEG